jgi:hypothetical protein
VQQVFTMVDLILKILYRNPETWSSQWIIGIVDKKQLYSSDNHLIEVKNLENKTIGKEDILEFTELEEKRTYVIDKTTLFQWNPDNTKT